VLTVMDPANGILQQDVARALGRIGDLNVGLGDLQAAAKAYDERVELDRRMLQRDPDDVDWQTDLVMSLRTIAELKIHNRDLAAARAAITEALALVDRLERIGMHGASERGWSSAARQALMDLADEAKEPR
jgi:hypothetical protein